MSEVVIKLAVLIKVLYQICIFLLRTSDSSVEFVLPNSILIFWKKDVKRSFINVLYADIPLPFDIVYLGKVMSGLTFL